ncbi:MAG: cell division protein ZapA [Candidatus Kapabacteria bacterium]|nr:cell division protein ZapA [Candidatus Kapabacteria bacterium]MDW8011993.1 cell division protein ZapA [Bacteroidota bacterium]
MEHTVRVTIAGREYVLRGEDERKLLQSAREVDGQWQQLQAQVPEQSTTTMAILVALNLAERYHEVRSRHEADLRYTLENVERMIAYADNVLASLGVSPEHPDIAL